MTWWLIASGVALLIAALVLVLIAGIIVGTLTAYEPESLRRGRKDDP